MNETNIEELFGKISIDEEQEEDRIEELQIEGQFSCLVQLLGLGRISNPLNQCNADCSQDEVKRCDEVLERIEPDKNGKLHRLVLLADLDILRMVVG